MAMNPRLLVLAAAVVALATPPAHAAGNERGAALFELCASCHAPDAGGNRMFLAPAIAGMSEWYVVAQLTKFRNGLRGTHFDDIAGMRMRPMALTLATDEDVVAVARHIAGLPRTNPAPQVTGGSAANGKAFYATCAACHGAKGEGMQATNAPPLRHVSDWYLLEQLKKYRAGIRGTDPRDPIGIMMRPMALVLPNDQAMKDVVAYITTLSR